MIQPQSDVVISASDRDNKIILERPPGSRARWAVVALACAVLMVCAFLAFAAFRGQLLDGQVLGVTIGVALSVAAFGAGAVTMRLAEQGSGRFGSGAFTVIGGILLGTSAYWFSQLPHHLSLAAGLRGVLKGIVLVVLLLAAVIGALLLIRHDVRGIRRALAWQAAMRRLRRQGRIERGVLASVTLRRTSAPALGGTPSPDRIRRPFSCGCCRSSWGRCLARLACSSSWR